MKHSYTEKLIELFTTRPNENFDGLALAKVGGAYAWRTRVSEARIKLQAEGLGTIDNTQVKQADGSVRSLYRFRFYAEA